jgi:TolB protein
LTSTAFDELTPIWSPDGSQVAFAANDDGDFDIYVMDSDGGNRRRLTDNDVADYVPRWSPDGSTIAFDSGLPGNDHWEVYVINVDGTNLRRVTNTLAPATAINPVWRPDPAQAGPLLLIRQGTSVTVDGDIPGDPV